MSLGTGALKLGRGFEHFRPRQGGIHRNPISGNHPEYTNSKVLGGRSGTCAPRKEPWEPPNIPKQTQALRHEDKESIRTYLATRGWEPRRAWESLIPNDCLRLLPTFRGQKNRFFFIWQNLSQSFYLVFTKKNIKNLKKWPSYLEKNVFSNKVNKVITLSTGKTPGEFSRRTLVACISRYLHISIYITYLTKFPRGSSSR